MRLLDFNRRDSAWNIAIIASTAVSLGLILGGLLSGITIVFSHLLYIPVVLSAYRYPRYGLLFSAFLGGTYFAMVLVFLGTESGVLFETVLRIVVIIGIGWLVATITARLRENEALYRGLFDHSWAGSLLIRDTESGWVIEEVNQRACKFLKKDVLDLKGAPVTLFWDKEGEEGKLSGLTTEKPAFSGEATFTAGDNRAARVVLSGALLPGHRAILTFIDITPRVTAENALKMANDKLNLLSSISTDHLQRDVNEIIEIVRQAKIQVTDALSNVFFTKIGTKISTVSRRIDLTLSYRNLGTTPPVWQNVQEPLVSMAFSKLREGVSVRFWGERLEVYADPLIRDVLRHIVANSFQYAEGFNLLLVRYLEQGEGLILYIEDNGPGIPALKKQQIFEYDSGGHKGIGLFICRQIIEVSGMTIVETGEEGRGARFEIHIPAAGYRVEGSGEGSLNPPLPQWRSGENCLNDINGIPVKELLSAEFTLAESLWTDYHETKGDPRNDRIFGAYQGNTLVSLARCKKHTDGYELDAVFTPVEKRGHGYAKAVVSGLVEACGKNTLYMHSVLNLVEFYRQFGFTPIEEKDLPPTIRDRYAWANGELEGADVRPMRREAS
ncbi:MAG: GNAT family N-acetyltransferase [Methanoregulaceae archaeon]|jgi:PAS domain-containing protein|nr:GNAT family N-acetyltransferase [Methanoregulaceae archaeon]